MSDEQSSASLASLTGHKRTSEFQTPDAKKQKVAVNTTPTRQYYVVPDTPCTPRTLASFKLERAEAHSILNRTHTITSLGHLLDFSADWMESNGRPRSENEWGLLLKAFEKTDVTSLTLHKTDICSPPNAPILTSTKKTGKQCGQPIT
jgi:hypothetical protein